MTARLVLSVEQPEAGAGCTVFLDERRAACDAEPVVVQEWGCVHEHPLVIRLCAVHRGWPALFTRLTCTLHYPDHQGCPLRFVREVVA